MSLAAHERLQKTLTILTPINNTMIRNDSDKIRIPGVPVDEQFGNSDV